MNVFTYLVVGASVALACLTPTEPTQALAAPKATYPPVVVLELFTSQGCSSCPSADRLLTETLADAAKSHKNIIGLSFHVDYWDRLGWKDPFSNHAFTQRQYQYSEHFNQHGVYTPQEVVNGGQEFVGSNRDRQVNALKTALTTPAVAEVHLTAGTPNDHRLAITYQLEGDWANTVLNVALVSKTIETSVQRGENAGRKLTHDNVVRVFQAVPATAKGTLSLTIPADFDVHNGAVVAYVQARQTLAVRGATQVNL